MQRPANSLCFAALSLFMSVCCARAAVRALTIAELRAVDPALSQQVSVAGYRASGDGGGGLFRWYPEATTTPDDGLVFSSDISPSGRWLRVVRSGLNPVMFGAQRAPNVDDAPALRRAFAAWARLPVNHFNLPRGTYFLDSVVPHDHMDGTVVIIPFFDERMTGRKLRLTGSGARLFSNISPDYAPILYVQAAFRSLQIGGVTFEKTERPLRYADAPADGLKITAFDRRNVDAVILTNCRFINCHRAFSAGLYLGSNLWGKLRRFDVLRCQILYPYGANALDGLNGYTGLQMTTGSSWIDTLTYRDCVFNGASLGYLEEETCPGFRLLDGSHFGGPLNLVFERNVVRHFSVEGCFQLYEFVLDFPRESFTIPAADGEETVTITLSGRDSAYPVGKLLYVKNSGFFTVAEYQADEHRLVLRNSGDPRNLPAGTVVPGGTHIFYADQGPSHARIVNNIFDSSLPEAPGAVIRQGFYSPGGVAIAMHEARGVIEHNLIKNCYVGIKLYGNDLIPGNTGEDGTVIRFNQIECFREADLPRGDNRTAGIYIETDHTLIASNRIIAEQARRFYGIYLLFGKNSAVVENQVIASLPPFSSPDPLDWGYGIFINPWCSGTAVHRNTVQNMTVGIGPYYGYTSEAYLGDAMSASISPDLITTPLPEEAKATLLRAARQKSRLNPRILPLW